MRFMLIGEIAKGSKLARTLYTDDQRVLLHRGTELFPEYLELLVKQGYQALYVLDPDGVDVPVVEPISERTRQEAIGAVREFFKRTREPNAGLEAEWVSRRILYNAASGILTDLTGNRDLNLQIAEMRALNAYGFHHSVNVTVLGVALGIRLGYGYNKLADLAMGLLAHDMGKNLVSGAAGGYHEGSERVSDPEYQRHARLGFDLAQQMGHALISPSRIVLLQHHERWDGSGFPSGLAGRAIHEFAQIAAIANTYDNLTHQVLDGRLVAPHQAMEYLMGSGGSHFNHALVSEFLKLLVPFPMETVVRLSTREEGEVIAVDKGLPMRPTVRVTIDAHGARRAPYELDLRTHPAITVVSTF